MSKDPNERNHYLQLENYNSKEIEVDSALLFSGNNFLDSSYNWDVCTVKFSLNTMNIPLHVPTLIPGNPREGPFFSTDWTIRVHYDAVDSSTNVQWIKDAQRPQFPTESDLYENKYFWITNAEQICEMVNEAFAYVTGGAGNIILTKSGVFWSVCVAEDLTTDGNCTIYFNENMRRYFNFNYGTSGAIRVSKNNTQLYGDKSYYCATTSSSNNRLFPFDTIRFASRDLPAYPQGIQQTESQIYNASQNIIFSYDLNISDISEIGNSIEYTPSNFSELKIRMTNTVPKFSLHIQLVTPSGFIFSPKLQKYDKSKMLLCFIPSI